MGVDAESYESVAFFLPYRCRERSVKKWTVVTVLTVDICPVKYNTFWDLFLSLCGSPCLFACVETIQPKSNYCNIAGFFFGPGQTRVISDEASMMIHACGGSTYVHRSSLKGLNLEPPRNSDGDSLILEEPEGVCLAKVRSAGPPTPPELAPSSGAWPTQVLPLFTADGMKLRVYTGNLTCEINYNVFESFHLSIHASFFIVFVLDIAHLSSFTGTVRQVRRVFLWKEPARYLACPPRKSSR